MVTAERLLTVEEFWEQYAGQRVELVEGVPVEMSPTSHLHGKIANLVGFHITSHVIEHNLGDVLPGFSLHLEKLFLDS